VIRDALTYVRAGANPLAVIAFALLGAMIAVALNVAILATMPISAWTEALD